MFKETEKFHLKEINSQQFHFSAVFPTQIFPLCTRAKIHESQYKTTTKVKLSRLFLLFEKKRFPNACSVCLGS